MTSDNISLDLQGRNVVRKGLATIRKEGLVPAVVHDHGKQSLHVMGDYAAVAKVYGQAGRHHPVQLKVDGKAHLALIKDVDREPAKNRIRHVVFQAIKQNEAVEAEIPLVFLADAEIPAERKSLMVLRQLDHIVVKALPKDLPDELVVDPSTLQEVGDSLTVGDIKVPNNVTIITEADSQIAVVEMPKDQIAEANAAAEALAEDAGKPDAETSEEVEAKTEESPAE